VNPSTATTDLLQALAGSLPGDVALEVRDADGSTVYRCGAAIDGPGTHSVTLPGGEGTVVATWADDTDAALAGLLGHLVHIVADREQMEQDMESMNAGSLALLEEVSMMGETLPRLAAQENTRDVAAQALRALMVAASVERAVFVEIVPTDASCRVLVHAELDESGFQGIETPYPFSLVVPSDTGLMAEILASPTSAIVREREGAPLGGPGTLESLARRDLVAVPVTCGGGEDLHLLGMLCIVDKRTNSFSYQVNLGSQETKLAQAIAAVLGAVLGARRVAELGKEFALAQQIQEQILPERAPHMRGYDVAADYPTSDAVGGAYFDYLPLSDGRTMVVIADVSGHNLASGMVMVSARASLRVLAAAHSQTSEVFRALGGALHDDLTRTERFITAAAVTLGENSVEFVSAGHNDVLWYHAAEDRVERLPSEGTIFGFVAGTDFPSRILAVRPGDVLFLYTDGVTEAEDPSGEMFGEERLCEVVRRAAGGAAEEIVDAVFEAVRRFSDGKASGDDVTAVAIVVRDEQGVER